MLGVVGQICLYLLRRQRQSALALGIEARGKSQVRPADARARSTSISQSIYEAVEEVLRARLRIGRVLFSRFAVA